MAVERERIVWICLRCAGYTKLPELCWWIWRVREGRCQRRLPRYMAKIPLAFGLLTTWDIREIGMADLILVRRGLALWFEWRI